MDYKLFILENIAKWLLGGDLMDFVKNEVEIINNKDISGEEKRDWVINEAKTFFADASIYLINFAIEVAVLILKAQTGEYDDSSVPQRTK